VAWIALFLLIVIPHGVRTPTERQYQTLRADFTHGCRKHTEDFGGLDEDFIPQTKEDSEWPRFGRSTIMVACFKLVAIAYRKGVLSTEYKNEIGFTKGLLEAFKKVTPQDIEKAALDAAKREIED
jgi:hypothetical protein